MALSTVSFVCLHQTVLCRVAFVVNAHFVKVKQRSVIVVLALVQTNGSMADGVERMIKYFETIRQNLLFFFRSLFGDCMQAGSRLHYGRDESNRNSKR